MMQDSRKAGKICSKLNCAQEKSEKLLLNLPIWHWNAEILHITAQDQIKPDGWGWFRDDLITCSVLAGSWTITWWGTGKYGMGVTEFSSVALENMVWAIADCSAEHTVDFPLSCTSTEGFMYKCLILWSCVGTHLIFFSYYSSKWMIENHHASLKCTLILHPEIPCMIYRRDFLVFIQLGLVK